MPTAWERAVQSSKQLTVFITPGFVASANWGGAIAKDIIDDFNVLMSTKGISLKATVSTAPPDPDNSTGANVQIDVSNGSHVFTIEGTQHKGHLDPPPSINGKTHVAKQGGAIIRAFIFMPSSVPVGAVGTREVGRSVKKFVVLHELLHACGLEETDPGHMPNADPDVFVTGQSLSVGSTPDQDRLDLGGKFAPPNTITARTVGLIKKVWP